MPPPSPPPLPPLEQCLSVDVRQTPALTLQGSDARLPHLVQEPQTLIHDLHLRTAVSRTRFRLEHYRIAHFVLSQHFVEFFFCIFNPVSIAAGNDVSQTVCSLALSAPHMSYLVLASHVPCGDTRLLVPTDSTLKPTVRIVVSTSWSFSLCSIVVFSIAPSPTINIPSQFYQPVVPILVSIFHNLVLLPVRRQRLCHTIQRHCTWLQSTVNHLLPQLANRIRIRRCCCVAAALSLLSTDFFGAPFSPNCRCSDASYTTYAATEASSSVPPLPSFVILLDVLAHF